MCSVEPHQLLQSLVTAPSQEGCREDPGEGCRDGQGSVAHGLQEGVEGAGLVQRGKGKSQGSLTADDIYLEVFMRITEPRAGPSEARGTREKLRLERCTQGKGGTALEKRLDEKVPSLEPFKTQEDKVAASMTWY